MIPRYDVQTLHELLLFVSDLAWNRVASESWLEIKEPQFVRRLVIFLLRAVKLHLRVEGTFDFRDTVSFLLF